MYIRELLDGDKASSTLFRSNSKYIQPKFLNTGSVQHVRPEALKQLVPIYYASLQDAPMDQHYSVFNHENLRVHYLEKKGV